MLIGLRFCYSQSTVSFCPTDDPICGLDCHDKNYCREDDLIMSFCCKGLVNPRVIGIGTWCGRPKIQQRGEKLITPSEI